MRPNHFSIGWKYFFKHIRGMIKNPLFLTLTILGNSLVFLTAGLFYFLEKDINPHLHSFLDALWWAMSTVTTVGHGAVTPLTSLMKIVDMTLMITGITIFMSYTALFASTLMGPVMMEMEKEITSLEKNLSKLKKEVEEEEKLLEKVIRNNPQS